MKGRIIGVLAMMITIMGSFPACQKVQPKDINVVLIVIDALRSDHLPFYGYEKNTAPFLAGLAESSVVFDNAFAASSWTAPATASIFTSLYPFQHGVLNGLLAIRHMQAVDPAVKVNRIPKKVETITEVMKKYGFRTYGVADNLNIGEREGFDQGFDRLETMNYQTAPEVNAVLRSWHPGMTEGGRYFLYIHYMEPHAPYHKREPWYEPKDTDREDKISAYDSEINYCDVYIKEMFDLFQWEKNTLVIITSDHGEGLGDHGVMGHGTSLFREQIQVPLMILLPEDRAGKRVAANVSTIDILPTVRELAGLPAGKADEGSSLVPLIFGPDSALGPRFLFSHLLATAVGSELEDIRQNEFRSTIYRNWQFILKMPDRRFLYNFLRDEEQRFNKAKAEENILRLLERKYDEYLESCKIFDRETTDVILDQKQLEKLRALGYVK